jgi:hypothetical protein
LFFRLYYVIWTEKDLSEIQDYVKYSMLNISFSMILITFKMFSYFIIL